MTEWSGETSVTKILGDFTTGWFDDGVYYESLLGQLNRRIREQPQQDPNEPSSGAKPKSRPPLDVVALDLFDACGAESDLHTFAVGHGNCELNKLYHQARRYLGYEARMVELEKVCGACGSKLIVAEDASTDVFCIGKDCDVVYRQQDWIALLYVNDDVT